MPERTAPPDREPRPELPPGRSWALAPLAIPEPHRWTRSTLATLAPDLLAALLDEGAKAERDRHKAIDALGIVGHEELVQRARYEEPITAAALALAILRVEREHRQEHLVRVAADAHETEINAAPLAAPSIEDEIERAARLIVGDGQRRR